RKQSVLHLVGQLLAQSDQIIRLTCGCALPQQTLGRYVDRFQRHRQLVALFHEVTLQQSPHPQLLPNLLRIYIRRVILARDRGRPHFQRARIGQHARQFVGQGKPQVVGVHVPTQVLQRQHCDRILLLRVGHFPVLVPPRSYRPQHCQQQTSHAKEQIRLHVRIPAKGSRRGPQLYHGSASALDRPRLGLTLQLGQV